MTADEHHEAYKEQNERADDVNDDEYFARDNEAGPELCGRCDGTGLTLDYDPCSYCSGGAR
jgi:hypothetical protein